MYFVTFHPWLSCLSCLSYVSGALYNIIRVPPEKSDSKDTLHGAKVLCSIVPVNKFHPSYYHSFGETALLDIVFICGVFISIEAANDTLLLPPAMSENYVVFIEQPIKMDLMKIVTAKLRGKALSDGIYWDPKQETVFHLVDKRTGEVSCDYRCREIPSLFYRSPIMQNPLFHVFYTQTRVPSV